MRSALYSAVAVLAGLALPTAAEAATINGGFEDGFTGWETIGDYRVETSAFGSGPVEGNSQAFLSTAYNEVVDINQPAQGNAVPATFVSGYESLEGFLGVSTFFGDRSLDSVATAEPIEGSAIKQTFTASAGDTLSFSWNFLTDESVGQAAINDSTYPDFNDFAFATIQSGSGSEIFSLADTISTSFRNSSTPFFEETGSRNFSYTIPTTGTYTLGIGVVDVGEPTRISGLLVDNVQAVPEADSTLGTLTVVFLGACWRISALKRKQKKVI